MELVCLGALGQFAYGNTAIMRVLRLIGSMNPLTGGPCQGIRNAIAELTKIGVHNEVVCLDDPTASFLGNDSFVVHALESGQGPWHYSRRLFPWLVSNLPNFDVVIVHGLWLYHSYAARLAIQILRMQRNQHPGKKIPQLFVMPHGHLDPYFQRAASRRLKAVRNWLYWKLIESKVIRDADGVLFTTETELVLARETFKPYQPKREINVGYGVEPPPPYTSAMHLEFSKHCPTLDNGPYLLFLSRIHEKKGLDLLINAYSKVAEGWTESMASLPKLVIVGPGLDTPYAIRLQKIVSETAHLKYRVIFLGMLTGLAKWGAFYGCEAFVLPSHQENFGIAVAEALGCGKPVLVSNQVNIWREIASGEGGFVDENTLMGTHRLLQKWFMLSQNAKDTMGEMAKSTFQTYFAVEPAARRFKEAVMKNSLHKQFD